jgi:xanthine/CO dehydrogenase XdhC/CoxF family maturation factor
MSWRENLTAFVTSAQASETAFQAAQARGLGACSDATEHAFSWGVCRHCNGLDPSNSPGPPTLELSVNDARAILAVTKRLEPSPHARAAAIMKAAVTFYDVPKASLTATWREKKFIRPRHVAMYLTYTDTSLSYPEVGKLFGGRDHTTILHACKKVKTDLSTDVELCEQIETIRGLAAALEGAPK